MSRGPPEAKSDWSQGGHIITARPACAHLTATDAGLLTLIRKVRAGTMVMD
jgi:hypothetical protein